MGFVIVKTIKYTGDTWLNIFSLFNCKILFTHIHSLSFLSVDVIPPVVTCPADIVRIVELGTSRIIVTFDLPQATDNSGNVFESARSQSPGDEFAVGNTVVTYTFSDAAGNTASCSFTVSVISGKHTSS